MGKSTGQYSCPACSAAVTYRSAETRIKVCVCGQVLNRSDNDDLAVKPAYTIADHNDWIRVGTRGAFGDRKFEVLGRFRVWLEESVYNYWTILFDDSTTATLAEGYGMYAILQRITLDTPTTVWDIDHLGPTDYLNILGEEVWFRHGKDSVWKYELEGEVSMPECTDQFRIFDLYARGDQHMEIIEFVHDTLTPYSVTYMPCNDLRLENTNDSPAPPKEVECTQCHKPMQVRTFPYAQSCSCPGCGARLVFKSSAAGFRASGKDKENTDELNIPLGATGTLKGITYEVIGYALKEENTRDGARWKEYVLYNRAEGYAFLSEYAGSWTYTREYGNSPVTSHENPDSIFYKGEEFDLYNSYTIRLIDTAGEFPFNIYDDQNIVSAEYISPPYMWVSEKSREDGINWFLGEYQDRKELLAAFPYELPPQTELGVLDPKGHISLPNLIKFTVGAVAFLVLVHFLIGVSQSQRVLYTGNLQFRDSVGSTTVVTPQFTLTKWRSNLQFDLNSPVDNNWVDMEAALVNAGNGQAYSIEQPVEYYHGYDDGEHWSEGSTHQTAYLSSIPSGSYFLRLEATRDSTGSDWNTAKDLSVTVRNDVPMHRNLLIFLALLLTWPVGVFIRYRLSEKKRWAKSRFSPFKKDK
jgi:hypothetical protein